MPSSRLSNLANNHPALVGALVTALRIVIGLVFVASGFAKAVDPWGSVYKIGEYLAVWGWDYSHAMLVSAAVGLSALEFLCGMMLLLGCYRRSVVVILLAMMTFMLPLTFYLLIANPVADCGCFGDWLHISDGASFAKNVAITIGLIVLLPYNRLQRAFVSPYLQWVPLVVSAIYILGISYAGYYYQPVVDFRSYPQGTSLLTDEDDADDAAGGELFDFIYEKDGESRAFDIAELPDSTWTFVERRLRNGSQMSRVTDTFVIRDTDGEDVTRDVISPEDYQMMVLVPSMRDVDISYTYYINQLYRQLPSDSVSMIGVIGGNEKDLAFWKDLSMAEYPLYTADELQIKELARGEIAAVMLHDGRIIWKRTISSLVNGLIIDKDEEDDADSKMDVAGIRLAGCQDCNETLYEPDDDEFLHDWTRLYAIVMVVIILVNNGALALFMMWRARVGKKLKSMAHHEKKS